MNEYENLKKRAYDFDETVFYDAETLYNNGDKSVSYILGYCLLNEVGTAPSGKLGVKLLKQAVNDNNMDAIIMLGDAFSGDYVTVKPNYKKAVYYYTLGMKKGNLEAQSKLGNLIYCKGFQQEGFDLVLDAYNKGYLNDAWLLSRYYELGQFFDKNEQKAFQILNDLPNPGEYELLRLARMHRDGFGTKKDLEKAFKYFSAASTLGSRVGMRELALCYFFGTGTAKSINLGMKYLNLAIDHGDFKALDYKAEIDMANDINTFDFDTLKELDNSQVENIMRYIAVKRKLKWSKNLR